jgi:hypothetical protein
VTGATTGQRERLAGDSEGPRRVGDMLEVAPDTWVAAGAIAAVERRRPGPAASVARAGAGGPDAAGQAMVYLTITNPLSTAGGPEGTHTVAWESPYPVEVLVQPIVQLKRLREVRVREADDA